MKLATSQQIRAMDRETIDAFGVPALVLMENAALALVDEIARAWGPLSGKRIAIVCGKGNNGGDGLAAARHLLARHGAAVTVWLSENPDEGGSEEFVANLEIARRFGVVVRPIEGWISFDSELALSDLIVDAVLGTGFSGDVRPAAARAIEAINAAGRPVVAVDIPSGVSADTGATGTPSVRAALTVTFAFSKPGLHLLPGADAAGRVVVADIGFPPVVRARPDLAFSVTEAAEVASWLPSRVVGRDTNKGRYGSVMLVAGSSGYAGAAMLSAHGASRSGAGLVTLGVPKALFEIAMTRAAENVMTRPLADGPTGALSAGAARALLTASEGVAAIGIGPGLSQDPGTRELVQRFVRDCAVPLVIDADALNALASLPDRGASVLAARSAGTILTPHPGEMGRLLGIDAAVVQNDRLGAVRKASELFGCVVLLKGTRTLIAAPDGRVAINTTGNAGMASGGTGDVLTGVATTLLAQVSDPWRAAVAAAYVHGFAGDIAAERIGLAGLVAGDVAGALPQALREIMLAAG
ncbi:MAG: NAD(P)H-hydrate dehydratase [Capsulimonadaceae bacterium]|nr:NAD(P)H-hydrate dehydratase [Capsulimonadaceae bacterium]